MPQALKEKQEVVQITTRVDPQLANEIFAIAKRERRSVSSLLSFAVEDYLEKRRAAQPAEA